MIPIDFVPEGSRLTFVRQTVLAIGNYERRKNGEKQIRAKALYECVCGSVVEAHIGNVKSGQTRSCGCLSDDIPSATKHGLYYHPLYKIYRSIIQRCYDKNHSAYCLYGGDGVKVCVEWMNSPEKFIEWALKKGWRNGLQVDKDILGGKIYSPDNCLIVTPMENSNKRKNNHRLLFNGESKTMAEWSRETGVNEDCISMRIKNGWTIEKTLTTKVRQCKRKETSA